MDGKTVNRASLEAERENNKDVIDRRARGACGASSGDMDLLGAPAGVQVTIVGARRGLRTGDPRENNEYLIDYRARGVCGASSGSTELFGDSACA